MAIPTTDLDIGTRYALQEDFNNGFVGRDRQVVIQTDDPKGYRPVIMDGTTQGGKNKVALVDDLSDYVPVDTYNSEKAGFETKSNASATYATKTELSGYETTTHASATYETKANASATYATKTELSGYETTTHASATYETKANASATYATKNEVTSGLAGKAPSTHTHTKSQITDFPTIPDTSTLIPKSGNRGALAGYEQWTKVGATTTLNISSGDSLLLETAGAAATINIQVGAIGQIATKLVWVSMSNKSITINGTVSWFGEAAPTLNKSSAVFLFFFHDVYVDAKLIGQWD